MTSDQLFVNMTRLFDADEIVLLRSLSSNDKIEETEQSIGHEALDRPL
jgi:hypothetical protein